MTIDVQQALLEGFQQAAEEMTVAQKTIQPVLEALTEMKAMEASTFDYLVTTNTPTHALVHTNIGSSAADDCRGLMIECREDGKIVTTLGKDQSFYLTPEGGISAIVKKAVLTGRVKAPKP